MTTSETKLCPFCSEEIKAAAIKCRYCGERLDGGSPTTGNGRGTGAGSTPAGSPVAPSPGGTLVVGQLIGNGRFELKKLLGTGGMGEVYLAEHQYTGQKVAIKAVWPNLMAEQNARARFLQEGRTLGGLKHANIVGLQDFFEEAGRFFLVMEFIEGVTLDALLRQCLEAGRPIELPDVERVLAGVLDALAHAHGQSPPVVHRDIKPSNVMLGKDGRVVLMDFGIAKVIGGEKLTRTRGVVGTYEYMSPEQVQGAEITPAVDVYAVGIMAFEMLAGRVPFPQKTDSGMEVMKGHVELPVPDLRTLRPECPESLLLAVYRALEKSPAMRYPDAGEMLRSVGSSLATAPQEGGAFSAATGSVQPDSRMLGAVRPSKTLPQAVMVRVDAGTFVMGSPDEEEGRNRDETAHKVTLTRSFLLWKTPVTRGQWRTVMGTNPSYFRNPGDEYPVESISWSDAVGFCNRLSEMDGLEPCYAVKNSLWLGQRIEWNRDANGYRLPSEAEWECAFRAGRTVATRDGLDASAWFSDNAERRTHPVGQLKPTALGLSDMIGNVWEWVWDLYGEYGADSRTDPVGPETGSGRVCLGGSWMNQARHCRAACRFRIPPEDSSWDLGFRVAMSLS